MSIYNLQDESAPFLLLQGFSSVLRWDEGVLLSYRMTATAMQVSASTLQLYADDTLFFGPAWSAFDCSATTAALCVSAHTGLALMGTQAVTTPSNIAALLPRSQLLRDFDGVVCNSDHTGRSMGEGDVYTVSMCDLVEGALRFVIHDARVHWIRDNTGVVDTVVLSVIALYAASNLAQHLSALMSIAAPRSGYARALNVLACVVCAAVLLGMCESHREYYVSGQDVDLYHMLLVYLGLDVILMTLKSAGPRDSARNFGHQIGFSTTLLILSTLRLHNTFNTPFLLVLVGIFGTRTLCKVLQHIHDGMSLRAGYINLASVLVDLGAWCWLLAYLLAHCSTVQQHLAVAVNVTVALLLGLAMSICIARRSKKR